MAVRDVAMLVAEAIEQNWTIVFEFTYAYAEPWKTPLWIGPAS